MDVQVKISISREAISEMAEIFREAINRAAVSCQMETAQQPIAEQSGTLTQEATQTTTYSSQIAQATQMPVQAMTGQPVPVQPVSEVPAQQIPVTQPVQQSVASTQPTSVPTASKTYTLDELASAAMLLMDRGMQAQLQNLLAGYGVEALPMLSPEQYGNFATALRGMGAQI